MIRQTTLICNTPDIDGAPPFLLAELSLAAERLGVA
jgi:hypothetical protein